MQLSSFSINTSYVNSNRLKCILCLCVFSLQKLPLYFFLNTSTREHTVQMRVYSSWRHEFEREIFNAL